MIHNQTIRRAVVTFALHYDNDIVELGYRIIIVNFEKIRWSGIVMWWIITVDRKSAVSSVFDANPSALW